MKQTIYVMAVLLAMLTACSQEDVYEETSKDAYLTITTEDLATRSVITGTKFAKGDRIGVYANVGIYSSKPFISAATFDGQRWTLDTPIPVSGNLYVYAYYPYVPLSGNLWVDDIDITPDAKTGQQEYLWAYSSEASPASPSVRLQFRFSLARITLNIRKSMDNANDNLTLRNVSLHSDESKVIYTKGRWVIDHDGTIIGTSEGELTLNVNKTLSAQTATSVDILVIPTTIKNHNAYFILDVNGEEYKVDMPDVTWSAERQYTYPVTVKAKEQGTSGGPEKVYMGFNGDNGKRLYWSSYNLGAQKAEEYGGLYGWGDPTGQHKEHYYEYKEDDPYYMTDTLKCLTYYGGSSPLSNISGTKYDVARAMWGGNWRIPSDSEFNKLKSNSDYEWTTYNGVKGMKFTSKVNGNSIFLPYSPKRYGNYTSYSEWNTVSGTYYQGCDYWSSNLNTSEPYRAHMFNFSNSSDCWIARGSKRYAGLPIRPVTE